MSIYQNALTPKWHVNLDENGRVKKQTDKLQSTKNSFSFFL